ncbi:MAG: hypothetical protein E3J47_02045 [Candidatus Stahlbacteria bacterium]|jgi:hypothetical protein|nr:hypothetical protein [candidate division WOR-3 bacterium]MCK4673817.1 hypothetical protein [candidate division WOR-3 bacterium]TET63274.1 MAG: hypothetical protein E3J47_02045 [Candidatus Stahlbacteria bacterium]
MDEIQFEVTEERKKFLMNKIAQKVVDYRLSPVAIVFLESSKPLSFLGNQFLIFMQPFYRALFSYREYEEVAAMLEDRNNIEALICEIERLEEERNEAKRAEKNSRH